MSTLGYAQRLSEYEAKGACGAPEACVGLHDRKSMMAYRSLVQGKARVSGLTGDELAWILGLLAVELK